MNTYSGAFIDYRTKITMHDYPKLTFACTQPCFCECRPRSLDP